MDRARLSTALEDLLELEPRTVKSENLLADLPGWDSMAVVGCIAMIDETFGVIVPASRLMQCKTVGDLAELVEHCESNTVAE
jgi:acyl carrier protein